MLRAIQFSTDTSAVTIAREWMFVIVSESVGGGSRDRNALIADANQPGIINSNGVFRVTPHLGAFQSPETECRADRTGLGLKSALAAKSS